MYIVEEIHPYNSKKAKVKLDSGFTFALYKGEIRKYKIKEGQSISDEIYHQIVDDILNKRARERALYLLKDSSKTKRQIIDKLKKDYYPENIIERTIAFLERYNYINDYDFAVNYIEKSIASKSILRIKNDLYIKGISKFKVEEAFMQLNICEDESIIRFIEKKIHRYNLEDPKDKLKFYGLLQRNGYRYDTINKVLSRRNWE